MTRSEANNAIALWYGFSEDEVAAGEAPDYCFNPVALEALEAKLGELGRWALSRIGENEYSLKLAPFDRGSNVFVLAHTKALCWVKLALHVVGHPGVEIES